MLDEDYEKAVEQVLTAMTEAKITLNSIKHMKEQKDALREQAEAVQKGV
jgi:hypothetical protein